MVDNTRSVGRSFVPVLTSDINKKPCAKIKFSAHANPVMFSTGSAWAPGSAEFLMTKIAKRQNNPNIVFSPHTH